LQSRKVRNSFEHVDERIDLLDVKPDVHIEPIAIGNPDNKDAIVIRGFDPETMKVYLLNESVDLSSLIKEIRIVGEKVSYAIENNRQCLDENI